MKGDTHKYSEPNLNVDHMYNTYNLAFNTISNYVEFASELK